MLDASDVVGFIPTANPEAAREFYEQRLGLTFVRDEHVALVFAAHNMTLRVVKLDAVEPAPYTVLGWTVDDIAATVSALQDKNISFERFPGMDQDPAGIWTTPAGARVAWFKDPDGNLLSVTQP